MKITYAGHEVHEIVRKYAESDVIGDVRAAKSKERVVDGAFLGIEVEFESNEPIVVQSTDDLDRNQGRA